MQIQKREQAVRFHARDFILARISGFECYSQHIESMLTIAPNMKATLPMIHRILPRKFRSDVLGTNAPAPTRKRRAPTKYQSLAIMAHHWLKRSPLGALWCICPMARYERENINIVCPSLRRYLISKQLKSCACHKRSAPYHPHNGCAFVFLGQEEASTNGEEHSPCCPP